MKIRNIFKKIRWLWIKFWGKNYRVIKDEKVIKEILFYKHRIYVIKDYYDII